VTARALLRTAVWAVALWPLAWLAWRWQRDGLGVNPIELLTRTLGIWALRLLLASLAMTPLRLLLGWSWPIALRRLLGLWAFAYVVLHFAVWIGLDHFFDWATMADDVVKRPYVTAGVLALLLLIPLAATSTAAMVRRLGARNWRRLHRLAYVAGVLAVLHYIWLAKKAIDDPYWYALALAVLLGVRGWDWARRRARAAAAAPAPAARPGTGAG
jgi:sulfoxide reductase heme-binding subunit YedZ